MSKFEIYRDAAGEYRWRLKAANGRIVAAGEGYKMLAGAKRGAEALRRSAKLARLVVK
jgi:hypothetical protein